MTLPAICSLARLPVTACAGWPREEQRESMVLNPCLMACRTSSSSRVMGTLSAAVEPEDGEKRGSPASGACHFMSCKMSAALVASMAPSRMRAWQPSEECLLTGPGTQKTSRPCSPAMRAVMRAPLRAGGFHDERGAAPAADNAVAHGKGGAGRGHVHRKF